MVGQVGRVRPVRLAHRLRGSGCQHLLCPLNQASALLRSQIRRLEEDFLRHGGLRERMTQARLAARETPSCPLCGKPMLQRTARAGTHAGKSFWGCIA